VSKYNSNGTREWDKDYGGTDFDFGYDIRQAPDGGFIVAASARSQDEDVTQNEGISDYWLFKIDDQGTLQWEKSFGGSFADEAQSVLFTDNNEILIAGNTSSSTGDNFSNYKGLSDIGIVKTDANGNTIWEKAYGGSAGEFLGSGIKTDDGNFVYVGRSASDDGDVERNQGLDDVWLFKIDSDGNLLWETSVGGSGGDIANSIQQTADGGFIVAGLSSSNDGDIVSNKGRDDLWVIKLSPEKNLVPQADFRWCIRNY
jgi:hypothetical protein